MNHASGKRAAPRLLAVVVRTLALATGAFLLLFGVLGAWRMIQVGDRDGATLVLTAGFLVVGLVTTLLGLRYVGVLHATALGSPRARRTFAFLASLVTPGVGQMYAGHLNRALLVWLGFAALVLLMLTGALGVAFLPMVALVLALWVLRLWSAADAARLVAPTRSRRAWFERWYVAVAAILLFQGVSWFASPYIQRVNPYRMASVSMEPTILDGDRIVARLHRSTDGPPEYGDIVLYALPDADGGPFVMRVVGLPGDRIEIADHELVRNGLAEPEEWAIRESKMAQHLVDQHDVIVDTVVPSGHIFVLGDNRSQSYDSRHLGPIALDHVVGTATFVYWSSDRSRIGESLVP